MVPCGIFETRKSAIVLFLIKKNWAPLLCNQFRHTSSQDQEVLYKELLKHLLNKICKCILPVVHSLPVTIVQKQQELSIYYCRGRFITERSCMLRIIQMWRVSEKAVAAGSCKLCLLTSLVSSLTYLWSPLHVFRTCQDIKGDNKHIKGYMKSFRLGG